MSITTEARDSSHMAVAAAAKVRRGIIVGILQECGPMTAQEVADELHRRGYTASDERNFAAPRLTELKDAGKVEATGRKICGKTGRSVTIWQVRDEAALCTDLGKRIAEPQRPAAIIRYEMAVECTADRMVVARFRQAVILALLRVCGPMTSRETDWELCRRGHGRADHTSTARHLTELKKAGKVKAAGKKKCGKTGRSVTLWQLAEGVK